MSLHLYPPKIHAEILTPNVTVLGNRASGRLLGPESRTLMDGIRVVRALTKESSLDFSTTLGFNHKLAVYLEEGPHQNLTMLAP